MKKLLLFFFKISPGQIQSLAEGEYLVVQITPKYTIYITQSDGSLPHLICRHSSGFSYHSDTSSYFELEVMAWICLFF